MAIKQAEEIENYRKQISVVQKLGGVLNIEIPNEIQ